MGGGFPPQAASRIDTFCHAACEPQFLLSWNGVAHLVRSSSSAATTSILLCPFAVTNMYIAFDVLFVFAHSDGPLEPRECYINFTAPRALTFTFV